MKTFTIVLLTCCASVLARDVDFEGEYLLPTHIQPLEYNIYLIPYLENPPLRSFKFEGNATILFRAVQATTIIRMHAGKEMTIDPWSLVVKGVYEKNPRELNEPYQSTDDKEFYYVFTTTALYEGSDYVLNMTFKGEISSGLSGLYKSSYDENGIKKWLATTFFESIGARHAFPCFDEPQWKAKFTLHIAHAPQHHVISNMPTQGEDTPLVEKPNLDGWTWTHFQQSVRMSSYLIAFVISDFESISHPTDSNYKIYARPGAEVQGEYANQVAPQIITFMEQYTGHEYSLPKMDQIAVPDFVAGAMENWGLVTYRETALLFQEGVSAATNRQRVATVVAHELAHQWFGNLVTLKWWNNIWLNEGFATYYQYRSLATVETEWQLEDQFVQVETHMALQTDSQDTIHPLIEVVENPGGSNPIMEDRLVYVKGGSLIRMMVNFLGEDSFKIGINNYLTDRAFNNSDSDDLWRTLQVAVQPGDLPPESDLRDVMMTWTKQSGYPVITVNRTYGDITAKTVVAQERFVMIGSLETPHEELWQVPLTMTSQGTSDFDNVSVTWLTEAQAEVETSASDEQWIIFNLKQVGFYRVNYDLTNWRLLSKALNDHTQMQTIHVVNRGQLMDDALALARAKRLDYVTALDMTAYLSHETQYVPWAVALNAMSFLYDRLSYDQKSRDLIEWYLRSKLGAVYTSVNGLNVAEDDSHVTRLTRSLVLGWACKVEHSECTKDATSLFAQWRSSQDPDVDNPVNPDVKSVVYCAGMRAGDTDDYDFLMSRFNNATNFATEQTFILEALACATKRELLERLLFASVTADSGIRAMDAKSVFTSVYNNRLGVDVALDFLIDNFELSSAAYGGQGAVGGLFSGLATKLNTEEQRYKIEMFKAESNGTLGGATAGVDAALVTVNQTLEWHDDHAAEVTSYFSTKRADSGATTLASPVTLVCLLVVLANLLL